MSRLVAKLVGVASAAVLAFGLAGCSAAPLVDAPVAPNTSDNQPNDSSDSNGGDGDNGRAFNSTDDAVITALLAGLSKADRAEWHGKSIKIYFPEGSVNDVTASIGCLAAKAILADDETAIMVYADGELDCSTM